MEDGGWRMEDGDGGLGTVDDQSAFLGPAGASSRFF
jgi:hypothetical protein